MSMRQRHADLIHQDGQRTQIAHALQRPTSTEDTHLNASQIGVGITSYQFGSLYVRRNDGQRILIVHDLKHGYETVLRFTPLEYAVLVPLLENYERPVAASTLYQVAFASPLAPSNDRRLYRHIDRMRSKLSPLGLMIRSVNQYGYLLLAEADNQSPTNHYG